MRNTVYARAGRLFIDPTLRDYFTHQPWYRPGGYGWDQGQRKFGTVDLANLRAIVAAEKKLAPRPVSEACPEVAAGGKLRDPRLERDLSALAHKINFESDYGPPDDCHRRVTLSCGPDIDGDGDKESIVQIKWRSVLNGQTCGTIRDSNDYWETAVTFLISGRAGKWRAVGSLGIDIEGDQQDMHTHASFVRRRNGELAVQSTTTNVASDTMCEFGHYVLWRLKNGELREIERGDASPPCAAD